MFVLIVASVFGIGILQKVNESKYYSNMETVSYTILDGAAKVEMLETLLRVCDTTPFMKNGKFVNDSNDALSRLFENDKNRYKSNRKS